MAQRKNSVQLSDTALNYLKELVTRGDYASVDDAASYLITAVRSRQPEPIKPETQLPDSAPFPDSKPNLAEQFRNL